MKKVKKEMFIEKILHNQETEMTQTMMMTESGDERRNYDYDDDVEHGHREGAGGSGGCGGSGARGDHHREAAGSSGAGGTVGCSIVP